jgi:hypothetical protein
MNRAARAGLEAGFTLFLLAAGILIAYISWGYGFGSVARPGPGLYPFFVGSAIALFAAILLGSLLKYPSPRRALPEGASRTLLFMSATFCAWILTMPVLGYVVVTALATYAFCKNAQARRLAQACGGRRRNRDFHLPAFRQVALHRSAARNFRWIAPPYF